MVRSSSQAQAGLIWVAGGGRFSGAGFGLGLGGEAFLFGAFGVEGEEAGEDFVADVIGPTVAPGTLSRPRWGGGAYGGHFRLGHGFLLVFRQLGAVVIAVQAVGEQVKGWLPRRRGTDGLLPAGGVGQAQLAHAPVFVEQLGKAQLGGIIREPAQVYLDDMAFGEPAIDEANVIFQAAHHDAVTIAFQHPDAAGEALRVQNFQQRAETVGVSVVRGGGEKQAVLEACGQVADRLGDSGIDGVLGAAARALGGLGGLHKIHTGSAPHDLAGVGNFIDAQEAPFEALPLEAGNRGMFRPASVPPPQCRYFV